jgi:hypothetical protein
MGDGKLGLTSTNVGPFVRSVLSLCAPDEIAAGSCRKRSENAWPNAPDRQNRLPLRHPRSSALRLSRAAFGRSAVDNAKGTGAAPARLPGAGANWFNPKVDLDFTAINGFAMSAKNPDTD